MTALDIVYGRQGGRRLPVQRAKEQAEAFAAAIADGRVVRASCICTFWWLTPAGLGSTCGACGSPMRVVRKG